MDSVKNLEQLAPHYDWNIILVNDGSLKGISDQEINYLNKNLTYFHYIKSAKNEGKGAALKKGFAQSISDYSFFTDIDFPYLEENIISMLALLENQADIVVGIRNKTYYNKVPMLRSVLSSSFKKMIKLIFKIPTTDTQAGLKAFSFKGKEIVLQTETNRYLFDLELIKRGSKANLRFAYADLDLKDNIVLSSISFHILLTELKNLIRIFLI